MDGWIDRNKVKVGCSVSINNRVREKGADICESALFKIIVGRGCDAADADEYENYVRNENESERENRTEMK